MTQPDLQQLILLAQTLATMTGHPEAGLALAAIEQIIAWIQSGNTAYTPEQIEQIKHAQRVAEDRWKSLMPAD